MEEEILKGGSGFVGVASHTQIRKKISKMAGVFENQKKKENKSKQGKADLAFGLGEGHEGERGGFQGGGKGRPPMGKKI